MSGADTRRGRGLVALVVLLTIADIVAGCRRTPSDRSPSDVAVPSKAVVSTTPRVRDRVDLATLAPQLRQLRTQRVRVSDPVYGREKAYEGYLLQDVVNVAFPRTSGAEPLELVFVCHDGYQPALELRRLDARALLATRDLDAPSGATWEMVKQGRAEVSPAPYYVVWRDAAGESVEVLPWPYGVVALEMRTLTALAGSDAADPTVRAGAALFRRECIKCHSMSLVGGAVGPELNEPLNVTEYWQDAVLRRYIPNPSAVRAGSRMPAFPQLTAADVDALMAYLAFAKTQRGADRASGAP